MAQERGEAKGSILQATVELLCDSGVRSLTLDRVAARAGCAKGLIHYHFKTKAGLLTAAAEQVASTRQERWRAAFDADSPKKAIEGSWAILTAESADGTIRAWMSLYGSDGVLPDRVVKNGHRQFGAALAAGAEALSKQLGLVPTIPPHEIGWLLGSVVHGMGFQLASGTDREDLEGAYAAAWLGILSLFGPR